MVSYVRLAAPRPINNQTYYILVFQLLQPLIIRFLTYHRMVIELEVISIKHLTIRCVHKHHHSLRCRMCRIDELNLNLVSNLNYRIRIQHLDIIIKLYLFIFADCFDDLGCERCAYDICSEFI